MIYAHLNTFVQDMAQLTIDNYWFYFIYGAEPFRKETHWTLYIDWLLPMLCAKCPFQFEHFGLLPFLLEFRAPKNSETRGYLAHVSALNCPVGAFRSLGLASSSLSTSPPWNMVAFILVTFWKEQKSTVGFCFCFYKHTHMGTHTDSAIASTQPISKQVFLNGKKYFPPLCHCLCLPEKRLKVTSGNFWVPLLRFLPCCGGGGF